MSINLNGLHPDVSSLSSDAAKLQVYNGWFMILVFAIMASALVFIHKHSQGNDKKQRREAIEKLLQNHFEKVK